MDPQVINITLSGPNTGSPSRPGAFITIKATEGSSIGAQYDNVAAVLTFDRGEFKDKALQLLLGDQRGIFAPIDLPADAKEYPVLEGYLQGSLLKLQVGVYGDNGLLAHSNILLLPVAPSLSPGSSAPSGGAGGGEGGQGIQGPPGPRGPEGPQGPQGEPGPAGPKGDTGATGPAGLEGPQGEQGIPGPKGDTGSQGAPGTVGPAGPTGETGPQGIQGPAGPKGDTGATGTDGQQGPQGSQGLPGATGPKGDTGADGAQGPKGDTGATGPQGPEGESFDSTDVQRISALESSRLLKTGDTVYGPLIMAGDQFLYDPQARNIVADEWDIEAGVTPLPTGYIYLVYEV